MRLQIKNVVAVLAALAAFSSCESVRKTMNRVLDPVRDTVVVYRDSTVLKDVDPAFLIVNKQTMTVTLMGMDGSKRLEFGIACGLKYGRKRVKDDYKTPEGYFTISQIGNSTLWPHETRDGRFVYGCYGPKFMRIKQFPMIGIHGTNAPASIGHRASEGCIRLNSKDIVVLAEQCYVGMPVIILPSLKDMEADAKIDAEEAAAVRSASKKKK